MAAWLGAPWGSFVWMAVTAVGIYVAVIVYTRLAGLRSFAKMSSFDFAMTVAVGSMIASTVLSKSVSLAQGAFGLALVYVLQIGVARARMKGWLHGLVDNRPLLLMTGDQVIEEHLHEGRVTRDDLRAKLREANVLHLGQVRAVVLESTGDIAVLHSGDEDEPFDTSLLDGVRGAELLDQPTATVG